MKIFFERAITWIENCSANKRLFILSMVILIIFFGWYVFLAQSVYHKTAFLQLQIQFVKANVSSLNEQTKNISELIAQAEKPDMAYKNALLRKQITELDKRLGVFANNISLSAELVGFFSILTDVSSGLVVTSLEDAQSKLESDKTSNISQHDITIELYGDYFSTIRYLQNIEESPWHFLYEGLNYQVVNYPEAKISLKLHTFSI